jgi:putative phosphoserine phosphatase/1-acylglycerol-3-phosphate O-acyltransferase
LTPRLAEFKKGAFHLAIQAGAPIVPIVIHNSNDVQPKGDMIFHPGTVDVEVLPPIDTSQWAADTISTHVREVRNQYLQALGQKSTEPKPKARKVTRRASPTSTAGSESEPGPAMTSGPS